MPPKRKRADKDVEASTRSTRSTMHIAAVQDAAEGSSNVDLETTRSTKKSKTTNTSKSSGTKAKGRRGQKAGRGDTAQALETSLRLTTCSSDDTNTDNVTKYDPKRSLALFATYADNDNPELMGPEGFERICDDAHLPMDGPMPLILSWQVGAEEMAKLTRDSWVKGTDALKVSSLMQLNIVVHDLNELLILGRPALPRPTGKSGKESKEPYDKAKYWEYAEDPSTAFRDLYMYSFSLVKPQPSKNIDMETARALWSVLLVPRYPLMDKILAFIAEKGTYRATNKDLWSMMLEFCRTVSTDLQGYDPEAAWPTLLDDFVAWKKGETIV